ncbi:MAG: hypothetical protein AAF566_04000 [Pseudomonadota bacterium]
MNAERITREDDVFTLLNRALVEAKAGIDAAFGDGHAAQAPDLVATYLRVAVDAINMNDMNAELAAANAQGGLFIGDPEEFET